MATMSLAMAAYIAQQQSGYSRLHVQPYNSDVQKYSVLCRTSELNNMYTKHQAIGQCIHEIIS